MHEYSIVGALVAQVSQHVRPYGPAKVRRLRIQIGELSGVDVGLLRTAYDTFRASTVCAAAEIDVEEVPARWTCPRCQRVLAAGEPLRCATCERPARLLQGDEIVLASIEMEVPDV